MKLISITAGFPALTLVVITDICVECITLLTLTLTLLTLGY